MKHFEVTALLFVGKSKIQTINLIYIVDGETEEEAIEKVESLLPKNYHKEEDIPERIVTGKQYILD